MFQKYVYTVMDAMPARAAAARQEAAAIRAKLVRDPRDLFRDLTIGEATVAGICAVELMAWYYVGRMAGSRSIQG